MADNDTLTAIEQDTIPTWKLSTQAEYTEFLNDLDIDSTNFSKSLYDNYRLDMYNEEYGEYIPPEREEGEFKKPDIGGPPLGQRTKEFFGDVLESPAMIAPAIFTAKYLEKGGGRVVEGLKDVTKRGYDYLKVVLPKGMPMAEVAHFMDSPEVNKFVSQLEQIQSKIDGLDPKDKEDLKKINKLRLHYQKVLGDGAKALTGKGTQTVVTPGLKILKGSEVIVDKGTKLVESLAPTRTTGEFPRVKEGKYKVKTPTFLESYKGRGYNVDEKTMRNVLKNHKNWSLFQFKGEISKFGYADAAKEFFKKGTAVTRFGQDMVGWKIGTGIGDAITEHTGFDLWGHKGLMDIGSGIAGYKLAPKVGRKIQQFVTNLPKKATKFFNDGRTQKAANKVLKKRGAQMAAAEAASWFPGLVTGPISETVIGLAGVGLMVNDLRKLYRDWNEDDSEEKIEMTIEEMLKKVDLPKNK